MQLNILLVFFIITNAAKTLIFDWILIHGAMTLKSAAVNGVISILLIAFVFMGLLRLNRRWPVIAVYCIQCLFLLINLSYFRYYGTYLHLGQYVSLLSEALAIMGAGAVPYGPRMLIVLIDTPFFVVLLILLSKNKELFGNHLFFHEKRKPWYCLVLLVSVLMGTWLSGVGPVKLLRNPFDGEERIVSNYGLLALLLTDAYAGNSLNGLTLGREIQQKESKSTKANVIVLQVESLGSNIVKLLYRGKPVMPFMHALRSRSVYFPYMLTYHGAGGSSDSEFAFVNSMQPLWSFPTLKLGKYNYPNSFVKRLFDAGYTTFAFHGNEGWFFNREIAYKRMGYSKFFDIKKMELDGDELGAPDRSVLQYVFNRVRFQPVPFFYHVITISSHEPFVFIPRFYKNNRYDDIKDSVLRDYFISMSYVDKVLGEFIEKIQLLNNTYVFIYGDHAAYDEFKQGRFKTSVFSNSTVLFKGCRLEFVPLLILTPEGEVRQETRYAVSLIDLAPTILNSTGLEYSIHSDGQDLLGEKLKNDYIPYRNNMYSRALLYKLVEQSGR